MERQGELLILMDSLQNMKEKANAYTSKAALSMSRDQRAKSRFNLSKAIHLKGNSLSLFTAQVRTPSWLIIR